MKLSFDRFSHDEMRANIFLKQRANFNGLVGCCRTCRTFTQNIEKKNS